MKQTCKYIFLFNIFAIIVLLKFNPTFANKISNIQENEWVMGDINAPITMIEYASLSCPHCASFHAEKLPIIKKEYIDTGKVKFVFRDFPLNLPALQASMISRCVGKELHFKYISALFSLQRSWVKSENSEKYIFEIVENGGVTQDEFDACLSDKEMENDILTKQLAAQKKFKIRTTPSFVINGKVIQGNEPIETFRKVFDEILND